MAVRSRWMMLGAVATVLIPLAACRDASTAPVAYNVNLGTNDEPLLPTTAPVMTAGVAQGTAEFVAFRDPKAEPEPEEAGGDEAGGGEPAAVDNAKIEEEIRDLVKEYNEAVAKKDYEALPEFYVKDQQEPLKKILDAYKDISAKMTSIRNALVEKVPDAKDRIDAAVKDILHESEMALKVSSLSVTSQTEVAAKIPPSAGRDTIHFRLMKDEAGETFWFMDDPILKDSAAALAGMTMAMTGISALESGVKGGAIPPETVLQQLEMMAKASSAAREQMGVPPATNEKAKEPSPG